MPELCFSCRKPAEDEYHWWEERDGEAEEVVMYLCDNCCEFACDVVELVSNLESEVEAWIRNS